MPKPTRPSGFAERKSTYRPARPAGRTASIPSLPPPEILPDGTVRYFLKLGAKGRVLLPAEVRAAMELAEGELVLAWLKDGELRLENHRNAMKKIADEGRRVRGDRSVVDELIAERRAAARRGE